MQVGRIATACSRFFVRPRRRRSPQVSRETALALLRTCLGDPGAEFRDGQWEAIDAVVSRRAKLLVVQRTGWGKSAVYFLATRILRDRGEGPTLLISPLLSLMRDQVRAATRAGLRAATINSENRRLWKGIEDRIGRNELDLLIISPERLGSLRFQATVLESLGPRIGLLVVDEAHCISDWGHDFRPDYQRITKLLPNMRRRTPLVATTATANDRVIADIKKIIGRGLQVSRGPLSRETLHLQNVRMPSEALRLAWLAAHLEELPGSGIIYSLTVRDAKRIAAWLQTRKINARAYWSGLEPEEREQLEQDLLSNRVKALVATTALGMGFDKPDLAFVIHYQRPGSLVHYYQQVGRAGRAIEGARGLLFEGVNDDDIHAYFAENAFPPEQHFEQVLAALTAAPDGLTTMVLEAKVNLSESDLERVLTHLSVRSPALVERRKDRWCRTTHVYKPDRRKVQEVKAMRRDEQLEIRRYMASDGCLMQFMTQCLNDDGCEPCGKCSGCGSDPVPSLPSYSRIEQEAVDFLHNNEQIIRPKTFFVGGALSAYGWRGAIPEDMQLEEGRSVSLWADGGWGDMVRIGKYSVGRFSDDLVAQTVALVRERWQPNPAPRWVTCVPSLRNVTIVPDFAQRLADALVLPFVPVVRKQRETEPQKRMQNNFHQAHNLEEAFLVEAFRGMEDPVLLVDDVVHSGWTFSVVGGLLKEAGSGPVFPLALALTSPAMDE